MPPNAARRFRSSGGAVALRRATPAGSGSALALARDAAGNRTAPGRLKPLQIRQSGEVHGAHDRRAVRVPAPGRPRR